jgi:hypothetical protein
MSKKAFDKIAAGLNEALAVARGTAKPSKLHVVAVKPQWSPQGGHVAPMRSAPPNPPSGGSSVKPPPPHDGRPS